MRHLELDLHVFLFLCVSFFFSATTSRRACSRGPRDSVPAYGTFQEFASDVRKVFSNAIAYHGGGGDDATVSDRSSGGGGGGGGNGDASVGQVQQRDAFVFGPRGVSGNLLVVLGTVPEMGCCHEPLVKVVRK